LRVIRYTRFIKDEYRKKAGYDVEFENYASRYLFRAERASFFRFFSPKSNQVRAIGAIELVLDRSLSHLA